MKTVIHRYGPAIIVLGVALHLGWPETSSIDDGDAVVRAKAVRWRPKDLIDPPQITADIDPFLEVLVTTKETVVEPETGKLVASSPPTGPPQSELESGLQIDGIAIMGGRTWAVINGRPRLPGDEVQTSDANRHRCEILAVETNHIVVRCQETIATLQSRRHQSPTKTAQPLESESEIFTPTEPPGEVIPPPPAV
jgi:hypothetical protein